jgi:ubiquitin C-terminal hydrolase
VYSVDVIEYGSLNWTHDLQFSASDMEPCAWQDARPEYSLYGVVVHSGSSQDSGHYYAYVKVFLEFFIIKFL